MPDQITTFANAAESSKALSALRDLGLPHQVIRPDPGYRGLAGGAGTSP